MFAIAGRRNTQFCDLRPFRKNNCFVRACAEKSTPAVVTKFVRGSVGQCLILELVCKGKFWLFRSKSFFSGASGQEEIMFFLRKNVFFIKNPKRGWLIYKDNMLIINLNSLNINHAFRFVIRFHSLFH